VADAWGVGTWSSNSWGGTNVTVSLLSTSASGGAGAVTAFFPDVTRPLTGSSASASPGIVIREIAQALTGAAGAGAAGSASISYQVTPSGRVASGLAGSIVFAGSTALSGASPAQGASGLFVPNITAFYTGTISGTTGWSDGTWGSASWGGAGVLTVTSAGAVAGSVVSQVAPSLTGVSGFAAPGSVGLEMAILLSGRTALGETGGLSTGKASFLTGAASANGLAGNPVATYVSPLVGSSARADEGNFRYAYWQLVNDSQTPNWTDIITE